MNSIYMNSIIDYINENKQTVVIILCILAFLYIYNNMKHKDYFSTSNVDMTQIANTLRSVTIDEHEIKLLENAFNVSKRQPIDKRLDIFKSQLQSYSTEFSEFAYWKLRMLNITGETLENASKKLIKTNQAHNILPNVSFDAIYKLA